MRFFWICLLNSIAIVVADINYYGLQQDYNQDLLVSSNYNYQMSCTDDNGNFYYSLTNNNFSVMIYQMAPNTVPVLLKAVPFSSSPSISMMKVVNEILFVAGWVGGPTGFLIKQDLNTLTSYWSIFQQASFRSMAIYDLDISSDGSMIYAFAITKIDNDSQEYALFQYQLSNGLELAASITGFPKLPNQSAKILVQPKTNKQLYLNENFGVNLEVLNANYTFYSSFALNTVSERTLALYYSGNNLVSLTNKAFYVLSANTFQYASYQAFGSFTSNSILNSVRDSTAKLCYALHQSLNDVSSKIYQILILSEDGVLLSGNAAFVSPFDFEPVLFVSKGTIYLQGTIKSIPKVFQYSLTPGTNLIRSLSTATIQIVPPTIFFNNSTAKTVNQKTSTSNIKATTTSSSLVSQIQQPQQTADSNLTFNFQQPTEMPTETPKSKLSSDTQSQTILSFLNQNLNYIIIIGSAVICCIIMVFTIYKLCYQRSYRLQNENDKSNSESNLLQTQTATVQLTQYNLDSNYQMTKTKPLPSNFTTQMTNFTLTENTAFSDTMLENGEVLAVPGFLNYSSEQDYRIEKQIAKGGVGKIYSATALHPKLLERSQNKPIAVKVFPEYSGPKKERIDAGFYQEVAVMHLLQSFPYFIIMYGYTDEPKAILMQLYSFGCMSDWIHNRKKTSKLAKYTKRNLFKFFCEIIQGIYYMHQIDIGHMDMKPDNVLIDYDEKTKKFSPAISDFGICHVVKQEKDLKVKEFQVINIKGASLNYAAPESILRFKMRQRELDPTIVKANDIYSLSMVLLESLTRRFLWKFGSEKPVNTETSLFHTVKTDESHLSNSKLNQ